MKKEKKISERKYDSFWLEFLQQRAKISTVIIFNHCFRQVMKCIMKTLNMIVSKEIGLFYVKNMSNDEDWKIRWKFDYSFDTVRAANRGHKTDSYCNVYISATPTTHGVAFTEKSVIFKVAFSTEIRVGFGTGANLTYDPISASSLNNMIRSLNYHDTIYTKITDILSNRDIRYVSCMKVLMLFGKFKDEYVTLNGNQTVLKRKIDIGCTISQIHSLFTYHFLYSKKLKSYKIDRSSLAKLFIFLDSNINHVYSKKNENFQYLMRRIVSDIILLKNEYGFRIKPEFKGVYKFEFHSLRRSKNRKCILKKLKKR